MPTSHETSLMPRCPDCVTAPGTLYGPDGRSRCKPCHRRAFQARQRVAHVLNPVQQFWRDFVRVFGGLPPV